MKQVKVSKKPIIIGGIVVLAAAVIGLNLMKPMSVSVTEIFAGDIKLTFSEEGFVKDDMIQVYPLHSGAVAELLVQENQKVSKGEPLCRIDDSGLRYELEAELNNQKAYAAQISDLDLQEAQGKDELRVSRNRLQGEYEAVMAQEGTDSSSYLNAELTKEEEINLQNIIIEQNRLNLQNATDILNKSETLFAAGALSQQEAEDAGKAVSQAEGELEQSIKKLEIIKNSAEVLSKEEYYEATKKSLQGQLAAIETQLNSSYSQAMKEYYTSLIESSMAAAERINKQIEECRVKAPASGIITELHIDKSNVANVEEAIAVISTASEPLIEVYVPTGDIGSVNVGDAVGLELKSDAETVYTGKVTEIDDRAVLQTSSLGIEKRKVKVTIQPDGEYAEHFNPGYDLTAVFTSYSEKNQVTIPRTAVSHESEGLFVWVVNGGKLEKREIEIGRELKTDYVVSSGISAGDLVVKDAVTQGLAEGKSADAVLA